MNCSVIIPVGPGHEPYAAQAKESAIGAWKTDKGPFDTLAVVDVDDTRGRLGRSAARNEGVRAFYADWHFFLDADDRMLPDAFTRVQLESSATFGAVCIDGKVSRENVYPVTRETLFERGSKGTLSMGCFVEGRVARETPFDESLDVGEDFDFYLRLPDFVKILEPLVSIGYRRDSAGGPRGYRKIRWHEICGQVIDRYREAHASGP